MWQSTRRGVLVSWLFHKKITCVLISFFIIFIKLVPKFSRTTRGKIFKNRHTHTHTDIVVEKEKEKPRTRDDDNERGKR